MASGSNTHTTSFFTKNVNSMKVADASNAAFDTYSSSSSAVDNFHVVNFNPFPHKVPN